MHNMLLFIIFHVVGDFYLQSDEVAKNKENLNTWECEELCVSKNRQV